MLDLDIVLYFNELFVHRLKFTNLILLLECCSTVNCSVWAQFITLRRFWRPGRIISSSNRSSCSSPSSSWFQMYFKFSNVPLFFTIVYLVGFKCTSQDFVGRTVVFSEKWKAKQYQMTSHCHISTFFSMTLSKDHNRIAANCTFDAKIGKVRKQLQLLSSGATSHLSSHGRVTACQPCLATGDFVITQFNGISVQNKAKKTRPNKQCKFCNYLLGDFFSPSKIISCFSEESWIGA